MEHLPDPPLPADLPDRRPGDLVGPGRQRCFWRLYYAGGAHPVSWREFRYFGPVASRFDHHEAKADGAPKVQQRGVIYAAPSAVTWEDDGQWGDAAFTALAEFFQEGRTIDIIRRTPRLSAFAGEPLRLLELSGAWMTRAGANLAICSGPRDRSRLWARAVYEHDETIQGVACRASTHAGLTSALWERSAPSLPPAPLFDRPLSDPRLLADLRRAARELNYDLALPSSARGLRFP